jgi:hypothetical protein
MKTRSVKSSQVSSLSTRVGVEEAERPFTGRRHGSDRSKLQPGRTGAGTSIEDESNGPLMGVRSVHLIGDIANVNLGGAFIVAELDAAGCCLKIEPATYKVQHLRRG